VAASAPAARRRAPAASTSGRLVSKVEGRAGGGGVSASTEARGSQNPLDLCREPGDQGQEPSEDGCTFRGKGLEASAAASRNRPRLNPVETPSKPGPLAHRGEFDQTLGGTKVKP
jgi:hypothetical protein